ncbi:MAG: HEAT repeat domain-containing protein [Chloroflexota bacterium]
MSSLKGLMETATQRGYYVLAKMTTRLAQFLSIRQGEGRTASLVIGVMLFTALGAAMGGTGIEALFFARFGVEYLPYMFLGLGITNMLMSFGVTAALGRIPRRVVYTAAPLLVAAMLIGARIALLAGFNWLYPALWLGKEVLNSLITIVIWGMAGAVCDTRQAKRLFPLFNASRILGQVVGGFATGALVSLIGTENLLLVWVAALLLASLSSRALLTRGQAASAPERKPRRRPPALIQEMQRGFQYVRGSQLMAWISVSTVLFSILYFSIALPFSRAATERFTGEEALASFLGLFNGLSTGAAFLVSLFLANRLFAHFGIMTCILAFPVIYLIGFGSLALAPIFVVAAAFRFVQMLWLSGIADPAWQTMFNAVPPEKRDQVRAFLGGVPEQAGTFIAGGLLIVGERTLAPQQLYLIGFFAAAACTVAVVRARRGYNHALIEALRAGRPHLFFAEEQPFGGFHQDAAAVQTALDGLRDSDPIIRRVSAEILGHLSLPESASALVDGLGDSDPLVRAACIKALAHSNAAHALLDIAVSLSDPEPDVRFEAVSALSALSASPRGLTVFLTPLLEDEDAKVSTRAAAAILRFPSPGGKGTGRGGDVTTKAKTFLRYTAVLGESYDRLHAIAALGEWGDKEALEFLANEIRDEHLESSFQRAILTALEKIDARGAIPFLLDALKKPAIRETSAALLGETSAAVMDPILAALREEESVEGALLALERLPAPPAKPVLDFARAAVSRAVEYDALMRGVRSKVGNDAAGLLGEALHDRSREHGIRALRAVGLLGDREAMNTAIENLRTRDAAPRADAIEALESISARWRGVVQPLLRLWEEERAEAGQPDWPRLLADEDAWVRDCAAFAAHKLGVSAMENLATLSIMERILFFKRVPLFTNLAPTDLKQLAAIAQEETFADGALIAEQGDAGNMMYIITSGEVRVISIKGGEETEVARRGAGDYVGEMALISREPRIASLVAAGDVCALCIDQKSFEALLRDRPDVSLAVIRVLCERLKEATGR